METILKQLLEQLKSRVHGNLEVVKGNEKIIKEILQLPDSSRRTSLLQAKFQENSDLLNENLDYLELQIKLSSFTDKYSRTEAKKIEEELEEQEVIYSGDTDFFKETIEGRIKFNEKHPHYCDDEFLGQLINYYTDKEEYEKCQELMAYKRNKPCIQQ